MTARLRLAPHDYTVGWLCALPESELAAATRMLDHRHFALQLILDDDDNTYTYGSINGHNVVIACLPPTQPGILSAQRLVQPLKKSFPKMKLHLFVGIGGGVPRTPSLEDPDKDIHLGDVVVGWTENPGDPAVVQWDYVRYYGGTDVTSFGILQKPHRRLLTALGSMLRDRALGESDFTKHLQRLSSMKSFSHPGLEKDSLYRQDYEHSHDRKNPTCEKCDPDQLVKRMARTTTELVFHQGTILSGDSVMLNARRRDEISQMFYDPICFEMEAAGVIDDTHCLVIRGIADYADCHKNHIWQCYAAGTAAAFARELLHQIQPQLLRTLESKGDDEFAESEGKGTLSVLNSSLLSMDGVIVAPN